MKDFTEEELNRIISWLPYRKDWPVDRNQKEDNISEYYGNLITKLTKSNSFNSYYSQDGEMGNYLGFVCYPMGHKTYEGNAILVCVSLCAPIAAYGQIRFYVTHNSWSLDFLVAETVGQISDNSLCDIEYEIKMILNQYNLVIIDHDFASRNLPKRIADNIKEENLHEGSQYLHGLFQINS